MCGTLKCAEHLKWNFEMWNFEMCGTLKCVRLCNVVDFNVSNSEMCGTLKYARL